MKQIHKDYRRPFLLEKTKLDRLMDIIHRRLSEHHDTTRRDDFEVFLPHDRREEMTNVDDVLQLDNSRKSKIQRLLITCYTLTEGVARRPEHEIQVDFDGTAGKTKIGVSVRSDDAGWSDRALSEVEEQIERTSLRDVSHRVALFVLLALSAVSLILLLVSSLHVSAAAYGQADVMWLRNRDVDRLKQILKPDHTITDEEMREIATRQLSNVLEGSTNDQLSGWTTRRKLFVGAPLLLMLGCSFYLLVQGYPTAVFLWGDEIERYNKILQTHRIIWGVIIALTVGVLSTFLYTGLVSGS